MITADTTVAELLAGWPELEAELIAAAPAMARLHNPVLRDVVASTATVGRVAELAGLESAALLARLRTAAGLSAEADARPDGAPDWVNAAAIRFDIDADEMLARGVHPIGLVRESAAQLKPGEVLRMKTGFRPQPLLEAMSRSGRDVFCSETAPGVHITWIR